MQFGFFEARHHAASRAAYQLNGIHRGDESMEELHLKLLRGDSELGLE